MKRTLSTLFGGPSFARSTYYCSDVGGGTFKCQGDDTPTTSTYSDRMGGKKTYDNNDRLLSTTPFNRINGNLVHEDPSGKKWTTYKDMNGNLVTETPDGLMTLQQRQR